MTEVGVRAGANGYRVVIMCSAGKPDGKEKTNINQTYRKKTIYSTPIQAFFYEGY
jgi:hypothetical protein